jgi:putative redox protein
MRFRYKHSAVEQSMECKVSWMGQDGMAFAAETGSGHLVTMDGAPEGGGRNLAPRPMEMVLLGTGGCTAYDVVMILKKSRQEIAGCSVTLKAERASEDPKVFTKIHFHFTVTGKNLNPATVERAINLSHDKYCSASIMIAKTLSSHTRSRSSRVERDASAQVAAHLTNPAGQNKNAGVHQDAGIFLLSGKAGR